MSQGLPSSAGSGRMQSMSTLMEIEKAAPELPAEEQRQLLRFLLRITPMNDADLPKPRVFSQEQIRAWIAEDEEDMRRFREGA